MKTFIQLLFIAAVSAGPMSRSNTRPIQLYSKTGKFMNILENGKVLGKRGRQHGTAILEQVSVGRNKFILRGVTSGLYIEISRNHKIHGVPFPTKATMFSEEVVENNFLSFRLADNHRCRLSLMKKAYRISCSAKIQANKISFLPRKTHLPSRLYHGTFV